MTTTVVLILLNACDKRSTGNTSDRKTELYRQGLSYVSHSAVRYSRESTRKINAIENTCFANKYDA